MNEKNGYAPWTHAARYGDLWKLLKRLGYDCGWLGTNPLGGNIVRICKHDSSKSRITLADEPAEQFVEPPLLFGVRLQLDNFGILSSEAFDRWAARRAKLNAAKDKNGSNGTRPGRKSGARRS